MSLLLVVLVINSFPLGHCITDTIELDSSLRISGQEHREYNNKNIIIHGDIQIEENASLFFRNCNITILWVLGSEKPHIGVSDNGNLMLENSTLLLRLDQIPSYSTNGKIIIQNNGVLTLHNSSIQSTDDVILWFLDNSKATFNNSSYSGKASESNLHWSLEDMLPDPILREYFDDYSIRCEAFSELEITDSNIGRLSIFDNATCTIESSKIAYLNPNSYTTTYASESQIKILTATQRNRETKITDRFGGFCSEWNSKEYFGLESDTNIILTDTGFDHLWLSLVNCTSIIEDADLWLVTMYQGKLSLTNSSVWILRASYGDATIQDSDISYLIAERESGGLKVDGCEFRWMGLTAQSRESQYHKISAVIKNTAIESCMVNYWIVPFEVNVTFCNVVFHDLSFRPAPIFEVLFSDCRVIDTVTLYRMSDPEYNLNIRGSIDLTGVELIDYPNTVLTREYLVTVLQEGDSIEGTEVQVLRDGEIWKSGFTDEDGKYFFEAKWVNHTLPDNRWVPLESPVNNLTSSLVVRLSEFDDQQRVTVLSSSPVVLNLYQGQEYLYGIAILLVITICIFLYRISRKIIK